MHNFRKDHHGSYNARQSKGEIGYSKACKHTILFIQTTSDPTLRTYLHFASVGEALDGFLISVHSFQNNSTVLLLFFLFLGLILMYEQALAHTTQDYSSKPRKFTDAYSFFDSFYDLGCLIFTPAVSLYCFFFTFNLPTSNLLLDYN